jgi:predicted SprT family Zn-dependent metalloprotease
MIKRLVVAIILLAASTSGQPDRHLDEWYASYNHAYFQDELPAKVIITRNLRDDRFIALTEYSGGFYHIEFNKKYTVSDITERETLLHEMCHLRQFVEHDDEFDQHGRHWQACMHKLADEKAFENLW